MFTGIIEHLGTIARLDTGSAGGRLTVHAPSLASGLAVSASIAVNGCCLTVVENHQEHFSADLSPETLAKTSFSSLKPGARVNLDFHFHDPGAVREALRRAGFRVTEHAEREPYEGVEYPSRRCYLLARAC